MTFSIQFVEGSVLRDLAILEIDEQRRKQRNAVGGDGRSPYLICEVSGSRGPLHPSPRKPRVRTVPALEERMTEPFLPGKLALLVGGGPAPGINGVIASVTIEAVN